MKAALLVIYLILTIYSFYILAVKSGIKNYIAYIPLYNALKVTNKPWWWLLLFVIPGINILMLLIFGGELIYLQYMKKLLIMLF